MNDPAAMIRRRSATAESAFQVGIVLAALLLGAGGAAGATLTAAKSEGDVFDPAMVNYMVHVDSGGAFNWMIFLAFAIGAAICFAVCYAAAVISAAIASRP